jgi:hypothetical protein
MAEFEIFAAAIVVLNFVTYVLWWNKPLDVQSPIPFDGDAKDLPAKEKPVSINDKDRLGPLYARLMAAFIGYCHEILRLLRAPALTRIPSFSAATAVNVHQWRLLFIQCAFMASPAIIFGAIHCIMWSFLFPSVGDQIAWRVCAAIIMSLPVVLGLTWIAEYVL